MKKVISFILRLLFWTSPLLFWLIWKMSTFNPDLFGWLIAIGAVILLPVAYEANSRHFSWRGAFIWMKLAVLLSAFYLFLSLLPASWFINLFWLFFILYFYRYLLAALKASRFEEAKIAFAQISLAGGLMSMFFSATAMFGLQVLLSLSIWPLLGLFALVSFINTRSLAFAQGWNKREDLWLWPLLALIVSEITIMLALLPLDYLVLGILSTLTYYSVFNFTRLYLNSSLTRKKIRNYAWFTAVSLIIILLSARWL